MTISFVVLGLVIGALLYALVQGKGAELGRLLFLAAAIAMMFWLAGARVHFP